ncbi:MAG: albusnodin/ikarugamycin family macrolactam cyclase [Pseudonocardiaceae bacterium]
MSRDSRAADRFFVGCFGPTPRLAPVGARLVWPGHHPLWAVGKWAPGEIVVCSQGEARLALFGCCLATDAELDAASTRAVRSENLAVLAELPGSFAAVLELGTVIHVVTDLAGVHPVFHTEHLRTRWFASSALPLAALGGQQGLSAMDRGALATRLFCTGWDSAVHGGSLFAGVQRVSGGHVLTVRDTRPIVRALPAPPRATLSEGAENLSGALAVAVQRRLHHSRKPTADLSGGLDSSSVVALAVRAGVQPVTVTYAGNADDVHAAQRVLSVLNGLDQVIVPADAESLPFAGLDDTPLTDEPCLEILIAARTRRRLGPARAGDLHLTGDGGDAVLSGTLTYLGDLARARRFRQLRREATGWARLRHRPAAPLLRAAFQLARTSWGQALCLAADHLTTGQDNGSLPFERHLAWAAVSPVAAWGSARARSDVGALLHSQAAPGDPAADSGDAAARRVVHWHGALTRDFQWFARRCGVDAHSPFLDNQVVAACLAVPVCERTTVTVAKPLLRAALCQHVPAGVLDRSTKGDYTAYEYHGLRASARELRALLRNPLLAELGVIDPTRPRRALETGIAGGAIPLGALSDVIAAEVWLRALDETRHCWWEKEPAADPGAAKGGHHERATHPRGDQVGCVT